MWPDAPTRRALAGIDLSAVPGLRIVPPDRWHVTLRYLGAVDGRLVPALVGALGSAVRAEGGPVTGTVGPATAWFPGGRILQVPVHGLDRIADAVRAATRVPVPGVGTGEPPFRGHLTVARAGPGRLGSRDRLAAAGIPVVTSFPVDAVHLVGTRRGADGPRYVPLGSVPLDG